MASSSSTHPNQYLFESRPPGRNISNSSSGSSSSPSYAHHNNNNKQLWPDMPEPFTPEMRDLQARGKDPYSTGSDLGGAGGRGSMQHHGHHGGMRMGGGGGGPRQHHHHHHQQQQQQPKEPFQKTERRDWAETVLDSPELLLMYAQSSGDTLPATRHKFKKIMCGLDYDDEDDDSSVNGGGGGQYHQQQQHQQQSHFNGAAGWSSSYHGDDGSRGGRR